MLNNLSTETKNKLQEMWDDFLKQPFPKSAHENDFDLEYLDSDIAGWISSILTVGYIDYKSMKDLENTANTLEENFDNIPQDAQEYFRKMLNMVNLILDNRRELSR